jgi:DNA-binding XRE family transcriptional regulator
MIVLAHTPHDLARAWRERLGLTREQLGERIGYAPETIYWMERGVTPPRVGKNPSEPVKPWVWLRYQRACQGLDAEIGGRAFQW